MNIFLLPTVFTVSCTILNLNKALPPGSRRIPGDDFMKRDQKKVLKFSMQVLFLVGKYVIMYPGGIFARIPCQEKNI